MRDAAAVACRGVSHVYRSSAGSVEALHAVDFAVPSGSIAALSGPSGCGKSTLLRLLAGIDVPTTGTIVVRGTELTRLGASGLRGHRRRTVSYVAQRPAANLIPQLTVREQLCGAAGAAFAEMLRIGHRLDAHAGELAGGEQARAAIAVALSRPTPVVLVDEPTAELDRRTGAQVIEALAAVSAAGRTVVVATHDPDLLTVAATVLELGTVRPVHERRRATRVTERVPVLSVDHVSKSYAGAPIVKAVTLELRAGEIGIVLGRSGSGKSTLMMTIGGWTRADSGSVVVPGRRGSGPPSWADVSYLAQRFGLLQELSVAENADLPLRLANAGPRGALVELLDTLDLATVAERPPSEVSIGQQQRTALARALVIPPSAFLADEPTSHQDGRSAARVWAAIEQAAAAGTACLVATHDETAAARGHRLWRLADGRLQEVS